MCTPKKGIIKKKDAQLASRVLHELNTEFVYVRSISMIAELPTPQRPEVRFYKPQVWAKELIGNRLMQIESPANNNNSASDEGGEDNE